MEIAALALVSLVNITYDVTCWPTYVPDAYVCEFVDVDTKERFIHYCKEGVCKEIDMLQPND